MKRLLLICVLSLFAMLNSVIIAQNTGDYCIWIENDQPSSELMKYVFEKPAAGETHTYSVYMDGDGILHDGKYNLKVSVERKLEGGEWTIVTSDLLYDFFVQTNVPANDTSSWYHLETDIATDGSFIYPHPEYFAFDGDNTFDYFRGHFLKSSVQPQYQIDGKSRLRFGFTWGTLPFADLADYRVKLELQERDCMPAPLLCRDYEIYYDRDNRLSVGGHQSINPETVFFRYFQNLVIINEEDAICFGETFEIGKDENLNPYDLTSAINNAIGTTLTPENSPFYYRDTIPSHYAFCNGHNIFDTVYDLTLAVHHVPGAPDAVETIYFGTSAPIDVENLLPAIEEGFEYRFYTTMATEEQMATSSVEITSDTIYYVSKAVLAHDCESPRVPVTIYLYPIPEITLDELADVCPSIDQIAEVNVNPASLRGTEYTKMYTWSGATMLLTDGSQATVDVTEDCDSLYTVTNKVSVTYVLNGVNYTVDSEVATISFTAKDDVAPTASLTTVDTLIRGSFNMIDTYLAATTVAALESDLNIVISDNCTANEELELSVVQSDGAINTGCEINYTRIYTITDKCGNATQVTQNITIKDSLVTTISANTEGPCVEGDYILTASVEGGATPYTYTWKQGEYTVGTEVSYTTAQTLLSPFTVALTVVDANGCELTIDTNLNVQGNPTFEITAITGNSDCVNPNGSIQLRTGRTDITYKLFKLSSGGTYEPVEGAVLQQGTFAGLVHGTYKVEAIIVASKIGSEETITCTSEILDIEVENLIITPDITVALTSSKLTVCEGANDGSITVVVTPEADSVKWYNADDEFIANTLTIDALVAGNYYIVTYHDNCTTKRDQAIAEYPALNSGVITGPEQLCDNEELIITGTEATGGVNEITYAWYYSVGEGEFVACPATNTGVEYTWPAEVSLVTGSYEFARVATNECGVVGDTITFNVYPTYNNPENDTDTIAECIDLNESNIYTWDIDNKEYTFNPEGEDVQIFEASHVLTTENGCDSTVYLHLTLTRKPVIEISVDPETVCFGETATATLTSSVVEIDSIRWWHTTGEGSGLMTEVTTLVAENLTAGSYYFEVYKNECMTTDEFSVETYEEFLPGTIALDVDTLTFCDDNTTAELLFETTAPTGADGVYTYAWTYTLNDGEVTNAPGTNNEELYRWPATEAFEAGEYAFTRTVTSACGTVSTTDTLMVVINPTYADRATSTTTVDTCATAFTWENNSITYTYTRTDGQPQIIEDSVALQTVNDCDSMSYLHLTLKPVPVITVVAESIVCDGATNGSIEFSVDYANYFTSVVWKQGEEIIEGTELTNSNLPAGTYTIEVNRDGCTAEESATITSHDAFNEISIVADASNVTTFCDDELGAISLSAVQAEGGSGAFAYNWTYTLNGEDQVLPGIVDGMNYTWPTTSNAIVAGTYVFTRTATNECGIITSISDEITVVINETYEEDVNVTICGDELPYNFRDNMVDIDALEIERLQILGVVVKEFVFSETTVETGCDSVVRLHLKVRARPTFNMTTLAPVCHDAEVQFGMVDLHASELFPTYEIVNGSGTVRIDQVLSNPNEFTFHYQPSIEDAGNVVKVRIIANNYDRDGTGCIAIDSNEFEVSSIPEITDIIVPRTVCVGDDIEITVTATEATTIVLNAINVDMPADIPVTYTFNLVQGVNDLVLTGLGSTARNLRFTYTLHSAPCSATEVITIDTEVVYESEMRLIVMEDRNLGDDNEMNVPAASDFKFYAKVNNECAVADKFINFEFDLYKEVNGVYEMVESVQDELVVRSGIGTASAKNIIIGLDGCIIAPQYQNYDQDVFEYYTEYIPADFYLPRPNSWKYGEELADNFDCFNSEYIINNTAPLDPRVITIDFSGLAEEGNYYVHCRMYGVSNVSPNHSETCGYPAVRLGGVSTATSELTLLDERDMFIYVGAPVTPAPETLGGVEEYVAEATMTVVPNPATSQIAVEVENLEGDAVFTISSITGSVVDRTNVQLNGTTTIRRDISSLQSGMYIIEVRSQQGIVTRKLVVTK